MKILYESKYAAKKYQAENNIADTCQTACGLFSISSLNGVGDIFKILKQIMCLEAAI